MSKEFKVWCDSGANIHSNYKQEIKLADIGIEDQEWDEMSEEEKDAVMQEIAWGRLDWGYEEIE